jgi:hypothetical protein
VKKARAKSIRGRSGIRKIAFAHRIFQAEEILFVKRRLKWFFLIGRVVFGLLQLTNASRTNPTVVPGHDLFSTNSPPPQIASMLRTACYDCHSYETHWPWYGYVAPVSWWLDAHVRDARERLNFSEWPHGDVAKEAKKWNHISDVVRDGDMPLVSYMRIHKLARLTDEQRKQMADWADQEVQNLKATAAAP